MILDFNNLQNAEVQDSNYTDTGLANARYNGSVASPTFTTSISDPFNSEKGDYPILRFEVAEGLLFELSTNPKVIEDIRKNPVNADQLNLEKLYFTTVVRPNNGVGFRQVESSGSLIQSETFFDNQSPKFQTFVYREVGNKFEKVASKQLLFLQQNFVGLTNENGKITGVVNNPGGVAGETPIFLTTSYITTTAACEASTGTDQFFITPPISSLTVSELVGKTVTAGFGITFSGLNLFYGVSLTSGSTDDFTILINNLGEIVSAASCNTITGGGGEEGGSGGGEFEEA